MKGDTHVSKHVISYAGRVIATLHIHDDQGHDPVVEVTLSDRLSDQEFDYLMSPNLAMAFEKDPALAPTTSLIEDDPIRPQPVHPGIHC